MTLDVACRLCYNTVMQYIFQCSLSLSVSLGFCIRCLLQHVLGLGGVRVYMMGCVVEALRASVAFCFVYCWRA